MIRDVCLFTKCLIDWNLPLSENSSAVKQVFLEFLNISDWLESDAILMNTFFSLICTVSNTDIGRQCCSRQYDGKPLMKAICMRTEALSFKAPHTESHMILIENGIRVLKSCSSFVEVRQILKSVNIFRTLETLHVHLNGNKKSEWDSVIINWLRLVNFLMKFEDYECSSK
jgi:hypothetical protein